MTHARPCRVVLLGMMGSGKTSVGRELARLTGWPYHDNDALLKAATGRTARRIAVDGPEGLRRAEAAALRHALSLPAPAISAAAAGVVADPELRALLRDRGLLVWLRAPARTLAERTSSGTHRPWLDGDALEWLETTSAKREPLYRAVADLDLDTRALTPGELARQIVDWLAGTACGQWLGS